MVEGMNAAMFWALKSILCLQDPTTAHSIDNSQDNLMSLGLGSGLYYWDPQIGEKMGIGRKFIYIDPKSILKASFR